MLVETKVGRLFVEERGAPSAPVVVLWHSLLCDGGMWRFQLPALSEKYRVINIDGPGHGRSAPVRTAFSLDECADAAAEILDTLEIQSAHWAGLSWGGMTGMRLALRHAKRVRSLAILSSSANREARRKLPSYHVMAFVARRVGAFNKLLDRIEPIFLTEETRATKPEIVRDFRDHLARMDPRSLGHAVDAVIFDRRDIRGMLRAIDKPTLVMVGQLDKATPPPRAREIADGIRGARLIEIEGGAHLVALERPERVNDELLTFFGALEP